MAKIDEIKEFIGYLKVLLALVLATIISLVGWLAGHFKELETDMLLGSSILLVLLLIGFAMINKKIITEIRSLEDL